MGDTGQTGGPLRPWLSYDALRVYEAASRMASFTIGDLSLPGLSPETAAAAVEELASLHLLSKGSDETGPWRAVPPWRAARLQLDPMQRRVQEQNAQIERLESVFEELAATFKSEAGQYLPASKLEIISDLDEVRQVIESLAEECRTEILTAQPGGARDPEALRDALARDKAMLDRGVVMRTLYQHTARYSQSTIAYVEQMSGLGAQVRTVVDGFSRMLVFDRRVGLLSVQGDSRAALLVHEPNVITFILESFQHAWRNADPFPLSFHRNWAKQITAEIKQSIIGMLAEGQEDKTIARWLGMSERTCQRHVAEIMSEIGAKSRFQAGFLIARREARRSAGEGPEDD
jgi:DNA-binding CsgD family transcriptional regulator